MTRTRRPTFSTRFRLNLFIERQGSCASCQSRIQAGKSWDIDHVLPLALGGSNAPQNLQLLCKPCHIQKTATLDIPMIAKTKRIKARHTGARAPSARPILGSRSTPWKKKMNGTIVRR